jgi:hypothetical protein
MLKQVMAVSFELRAAIREETRHPAGEGVDPGDEVIPLSS